MKIVSDGTPNGTKVFNDDGSEFDGLIEGIDYRISAMENGQLTMYLYAPKIEIEADPDFVFNFGGMSDKHLKQLKEQLDKAVEDRGI